MAVLHVDLAAAAENLRGYSQSCPVIPVLKDNAYGLGAAEVMRKLRREGYTLFACSRPEEALTLSDQEGDLLLLCCVHDPDLSLRLAQAGVIQSVESLEQANMLDRLGLPVRIHLAVDTGFGRFGFSPQETDHIRQVFSLKNLSVEGIFSHFRSTASAPEQLAVFRSVLDKLEGCPLGIRHIAATLNAGNPDCQLDAVRIGTGYTGVLSGQKRAAVLTATVVTMRSLPKGSRVGYTGAKLKRDTTVAIVDVGTGDGAFVYRSCGPRTWLAMRRLSVELGEYRPRVLGLPGLTHTAIDVTGIPCKIGDRVVISQTPVLISPSVPREYTGEE